MKTRTHKSVKFNARELAYDGPGDVEFQRSVPVGRGPKALFAKPATAIQLDSDLARQFKTSKEVNAALRTLIELRRLVQESIPAAEQKPSPKKKSA